MQESLDRFYFRTGPCCAGCDWWRAISPVVGDCTRSAPVSGDHRWQMVGIRSCSLPTASGHVVTTRDHVCGEFRDDFDWSTLPLVYRARIGAPL